ncbi:MAG TPA: hypothetical protein VKV40_21665 [Ktedonobacteraceae bacterium]|nr:hypothetical protein [Ktedonobacteraceae bacterium]
MRIKPQSRLKQGLLLSRFTRASRRYAGRMLPQPAVQNAQGRRVLLDEVPGNNFVLLRLHAQPRRASSALTAEPWHWMCASSASARSASRNVLQDRTTLPVPHGQRCQKGSP